MKVARGYFHLARQSENTQLPDVRRESIDLGAFTEDWAEPPRPPWAPGSTSAISTSKSSDQERCHSR